MDAYGAALLADLRSKIPGRPFEGRINADQALPPTQMQTFASRSPLKTHFRPAFCEEYECDSYKFGWVTTVDTSTELGQKRAYFIEHDRNRSSIKTKVAPNVIKYAFLPGQRCFAGAYDEPNHYIQLERERTFLVVGGDWRGLTSPTRVHTRPEHWVEEMQETFDRVRTIQERG